MIINKRIAASFLICNALLVGEHIFIYFYLHDSVFETLEKTPYGHVEHWQVVAGIETLLRFIQMGGLLWVLSIFKEPWWIRAGIIAFITSQLVGVIFSFFLAQVHFNHPLIFFTILAYFNMMILIYMFVGVLRIREKHIKPYLIWYVVLVFCAVILPLLGRFLYDSLGYQWLPISRNFMVKLPSIAALILFVDVYNIANKKPAPNN